MYIDLSISNIKIKVLFADCIYFHTLKLTLISEGEYNKSNSFLSDVHALDLQEC